MQRLSTAFLSFLALTAVNISNASADVIPFFSAPLKLDWNRWYVSNGWANGNIQSCEWKKDAITFNEQNLVFTLSDRGGKIRPLGCPEIHVKKVTGYGTYEARLRSAKGSGLNTAFFTYVGPPVGVSQHDEIDFEFLGKDSTTVQLNYYVSGKPQDGTFIKLGFDASAGFHNYRFVWAPDKISWYVDDKLVHETKAGAALPSHPGRIYLSLWSGSAAVNDWLGPFKYTAPVTAEFEWVKFTPLN